MKIKFSRLAHLDLDDIFLYTTSKWSLRLAENYIDEVLTCVDQLLHYPQSGVRLDGMLAEFRKVKVRMHFIYYKINRRRQEIIIVRILHQSRDIVTSADLR
ncbi:type II toxin-antitoxin system RelE/ParE family toxin [Phaeocystidibacter luteus]|uniref:Type II toxin-antitoxin system RelE/ParE family toxin n=1 Tax=Phaeocystidibacter luteus TaxID=911197 RepID=A0A6N6RFP6_9FLAO|nr:type II toxin-antitoxin system RelE/ParE family toxin [Phaeocystidibacter luteus]